MSKLLLEKCLPLATTAGSLVTAVTVTASDGVVSILLFSPSFLTIFESPVNQTKTQLFHSQNHKSEMKLPSDSPPSVPERLRLRPNRH